MIVAGKTGIVTAPPDGSVNPSVPPMSYCGGPVGRRGVVRNERERDRAGAVIGERGDAVDDAEGPAVARARDEELAIGRVALRRR